MENPIRELSLYFVVGNALLQIQSIKNKTQFHTHYVKNTVEKSLSILKRKRHSH